MRPERLVPVKWRLPECARTILPVPVNLKRLAAPRCVFSLFFGLVEFLGIAGISPTCQRANPPTESLSTLLFAWLGRSGAAPLQANRKIYQAGCAACCELGFATGAPFLGASSATKTLPSMRGMVS